MSNRSGKPVQVYLGEAMHQAILALARGNQRTLSEEIVHAIERHLGKPPRRKVTTVTPELPQADVEAAQARAKKRRGPKLKKTQEED